MEYVVLLLASAPGLLAMAVLCLRSLLAGTEPQLDHWQGAADPLRVLRGYADQDADWSPDLGLDRYGVPGAEVLMARHSTAR